MNDAEFVHYYESGLIGWLELRASSKGVRSITFVDAPREAAESRINPILAQLVSELDTYFAQRLTSFQTPLDLRTGTPFQRAVWQELTRIPYGSTRSYADVADAIGRPRAVRAVGQANGANTIPIVIPCHRVIRADGALGGYSSGIRIKRALLGLEGVSLENVPGHPS